MAETAEAVAAAEEQAVVRLAEPGIPRQPAHHKAMMAEPELCQPREWVAAVVVPRRQGRTEIRLREMAETEALVRPAASAEFP